jgi:hypothetical protein
MRAWPPAAVVNLAGPSSAAHAEPDYLRALTTLIDTPTQRADSAIRAPRSVLYVPARSLAEAMDGQEEARLAPSRTLAMLSLPSTARAPATHAVLAIISGRLNTAGQGAL